MADLIDLDPALRALDGLAGDFAAPGDETSACVSMWPLLAVPSDALSPLDRDARDRHLARCARCRVALAEAWLDAGGETLAPAAAPLPAATALPALPDKRRRATKILASFAVAAAAAASLFTIVYPMMRSSSPEITIVDHEVVPLDSRPIELVFVAEDSARDPKNARAIDAALAQLRDQVPADTRVTIATARGDRFTLIARDRAPTDTLSIPPPEPGDEVAPVYETILAKADALFEDQQDRRAIVLLGTACGPWSAHQAADSVIDQGVAITSVHLRALECAPIVRSRFVARSPGGVATTIHAAVDTAVRAASVPPGVEERAPLDLLVLIDGHASFMDGPAYDDVRTALDELDRHVPAHSRMRFAKMVGDAVTPLGHGDYPYIPLARAVIGDPTAYERNLAPPRYAVALERARHILDERHDRTAALLIISTGCELVPSEDAARARELAALRAAGVPVTMVEYRPDVLGTCVEAFPHGTPDIALRGAITSSALPGLVADAVEDFARPRTNDELLHFVHHTLSAP